MHSIIKYLDHILSCYFILFRPNYSASFRIFINFDFAICDGHSAIVIAENVDENINIHAPNPSGKKMGSRDKQLKHTTEKPTMDDCILAIFFFTLALSLRFDVSGLVVANALATKEFQIA